MRTFVLAIALLLVSSCTPDAIRAQAGAANQVAIAANRALPDVVRLYQDAGLALIAASPTREVAEERLATLIEEWTPVWGTCGMILEGSPPQTLNRRCTPGAWNLLEQAHGVWAQMLERHLAGEPVDAADVVLAAGRLHDAYCTLRSVLANHHPLPDVPLMPCATPSGATPDAGH